ncbi:MAG: EAL domain-containing protein [Vulcanimicrobiaceae bacterium]
MADAEATLANIACTGTDTQTMDPQARIDGLAAAAAYGVGAASGAIYFESHGTFELAALHGSLPAALPRALPTLGSYDVLVVDGLDDGWFFAAARIAHHQKSPGYLCVWDDTPRTLTCAQQYLLRTLAAEVGVAIELERLRAFERQTLAHTSERETRLRLLESVVVNANDAVLITEAEPIDLPGPRILYANAAFTRTTGYELHEIVGKTPRLLQGPDTEFASREKLRAALKEWRPVEVELLNYRKDGRPFWVELSIVPVADAKGWFTHWVSVQRDITERKKAEEIALRVRLAEAQNEALELEIAERKRVEAQLAFAAFHDDLTGLRNRAYFIDRLEASLLRAQSRAGYRCAVIFLDLDGFKLVNDTLGHRTGDLMLTEVARRLARCARPQDTLARMGGDEFTLLVDDVSDVAMAASIAERILAELEAPFRLAGKEVVPSASIGISMLDGHCEASAEALRDADTAMYRAKHDGGACYAVFVAEMQASAVAALHTRLELRSAFDRDEFVLYYQPLVEMTTRHIRGLEALVRWQHPSRGIVAPAEFIPLAEETGLIVPLGAWILRAACRQMQLWLESGRRSEALIVSVNVSSRQLCAPGFYEEVYAALAETGLDARRLQLEITESVFVEQAQRIGTLLARIRALGVRVAFDDFGTGYSSLSYLERYRIDTLKIDQSFVRHLIEGAANADIVRMIIGLARALEIDVTAEGVENHKQRDALIAYGCTIAQGYLYSRPIPAREIPALLDSSDALVLH